MPKTAKQETGKWGERQAAVFLQSLGYEIVEINFKIRGGEIDLIAYHTKPHFGRTLCFIEVKTRKSADGSAERAVGRDKMDRLFKTAKMYCVEKQIDIYKTPIQFEQISIYGEENKNKIFHYVIPVN